jgi:hypothetical protein
MLESVFCFLRIPYAVKCKSFWWGEEQLHRSPKSFWWGEEQLHRSPKSFWWEEERLYRSPKPLGDNLSSAKNSFFVCDESLRSNSCALMQIITVGRGTTVP